MLEAEVYRLGFCRLIRWVLQSLRSRRLSENVLTFQSEQNVRSGFGLFGHRLSRSLLGGDTLVNRQSCEQTVQLSVAKKTRQRFVSRVTKLYEQGSIHDAKVEGW